MNILIYILIFIMGTIFGSFLTLATYRIPLHKDILYSNSFCTKCNHKLSFLDLIPIVSFLCLKGRCRYCKGKISIRYPLIEMLTGLAFVILALGIGITVDTILSYKGIELILGILLIVFLFLIAGIDIEHNEIHKGVLIYGIVISVLNIIYQSFITYNYNLVRIAIYFAVIAILTIISTFRIKKKSKDDYNISVVILCIILNFFCLEIGTILTIIYTLLIILIKLLINKIIYKGKKYNKKLPIAAYICIANAIVWIFIFLFQIGV